MKGKSHEYNSTRSDPAGMGQSILWIASIAVVYFILARFSLSFLFKPEGIAAIWPLTGIFLSAVLLTRSNVRPYLVGTLFFTDFIAEMLAGTPFVVSIAYAAALSGDAVLGAWLLLRFVGEPITFHKVRDVIGFLFLAVFLSNALMSIAAALAANIYLGVPFWSSWFWWFSSDGVGSLLVTPFIMSFAYSIGTRFREFKKFQLIEGAVLFLIMALINDYALSNFLNDHQFTMLLGLITFPFLILASFRFGAIGAATASIILAMVVLHNTISGQFTQFGAGSNLNNIIFVQIYIAMISIPSMLMASLITERKQKEELLRASLEEKTVLLNEIHHRVKNNLQIVSSMLSLQAMRTKNMEALDALRETGNRVNTMAQLHETLYHSGNMAKMSFSGYIDNICAHIMRSYGPDAGNIKLERHLANLNLDLDQAVPCGLIITELVSNALKHAFPEGQNGLITVELQERKDDLVMLKVADNGIGLPQGLDVNKSDTLGLKLLSMLTEKLKGSVEVIRDKGTTFQVTFRKKKDKEKQL